MKSRLIVTLAFSTTAMLVAAASAPALDAYLSTQPILEFKPSADRTINKDFEQYARKVIVDNGDLEKFTCLRLLPYNTPNTFHCSDDGAFDDDYKKSGRYYLNAKIGTKSDKYRISNEIIDAHFPSESRDALQLFIAAHEFKHYLNFKNGAYQPVRGDRGYGAFRAAIARSRANEYDADLYGLSVVQKYHPDKYAVFKQRLIKFRMAEADTADKSGARNTHSGLVNRY